MKAGILNEPIKILRVNISRNEYGEQFDMYSPLCDTRARVELAGGTRANTNDEIFFEHTLKFYVRRYVPVQNFDRILYKCEQYRILNIDDDKPFNQKIITAELINL